MSDVTLKRNTATLTGAIFQSVSFIAPAASAASYLVIMAGFVGAAAPFAFIFAALAVLSGIFSTYNFSKRISHAGGYYSFVTAGLGAKIGVASSWFYLAVIITAVASFPVAFFSGVVTPEIPVLASLSYGWILVSLIPMIIIFVTLYFGLRISLYYTLVGGALEVGFLIISSIIILARAGHLSAIPFTPAGASFGNMGYAILYGSLSFAGVSQLVTIAEETKTPKRLIPLGIITAFSLAAVSFLLFSYALIEGWGIGNIGSLVSATDPGFTVVQKYLGTIGVIIFMIITANSFISCGIATANVSTRSCYGMARESILFPRSFMKLNKHGTPITVLAILFIVTVISMYGLGIFVGPFEAGAILTGFEGILLYLTHILMNFSLPIYAKKTLKAKLGTIFTFSAAPLASTAIYIFAISSFFYPFPTFPSSIPTYLGAAMIIIGVLIALIYSQTKTKEYFKNIGTEKYKE